MGAAAVLVIRDVNRRLLDGMLGFAGGVMIAASYWSLLAPAIEMSQGRSGPVWMPAAAGFLAGGLFLLGIDRILPHLHLGLPTDEAEGIKTSWQRSTLLILAIALHHIPEGLAVGVAFGSAAAGASHAGLAAAAALTVGIAIQNFPEGLAVSMPLRREGLSPAKSFWLGQLAGAVEPAAGVVGALVVMSVQAILPYGLGFAAGAMIYVVVEEIIPESQRGQNTDLATVCAMAGFALMMILDVGMG